jgi:hypothetical protein
LGETMAMALAQQGQFAEAAEIQRGVIAAAERAGLTQDVRRMTGNLRRYERGEPCRTPWSDDDQVHVPAMFAPAAPVSP